MNLTPIRRLVQRTKQYDPKTLGRDAIVYIDISSIDRQTKRITEPQSLAVDGAPSRARKQVHADDVLVATVRPNLNSVALVPLEYHNEIASTGFCVLRANKDALDPLYLFYFTQTTPFVSRLTQLSIGAGYPAVSDDNILDTEIPLPPLPEQQYIAAILAKADRLRRLRRAARELGDTYLRSVFLEMFGDPVSNPKGWEVKTLSGLKTKLSYGTSTRCYTEPKGLPVLRIPNVLGKEISLEDLKYAELPEKEVAKLSLVQGDLLFVRTNGNPDYVGRCAIFDLDTQYLFASYLIRARLDLSKVNPWFLATYLRTSAGRQAMSPYIRTTAGQSNIGMEGLGQIPVPLPPLPLQQQFTHVVHQFEHLRAQQREAERQAEHLFQTLLHRAFRGEMTSDPKGL